MRTDHEVVVALIKRQVRVHKRVSERTTKLGSNHSFLFIHQYHVKLRRFKVSYSLYLLRVSEDPLAPVPQPITLLHQRYCKWLRGMHITVQVEFEKGLLRCLLDFSKVFEN